MPIVTTDLSLFEFILIFSLGAGYLNGFDGSFLFPTIGVGMLTFSFSPPPVLKFFCCMLQLGGWREKPGDEGKPGGTRVSLGERG